MLKTRLEKFYEKVVCEDFVLLYNLKSIYTLPVFEKAILNTTSSNFVSEKEALLQQFSAFFLQTGKLPINTRAHNSIALFNIRQGNILGLKTTLRKQTLYNYLDKILIFVIPKMVPTTSMQKPMENQPAQFSPKKMTLPLIKMSPSRRQKNNSFNEEMSRYDASPHRGDRSPLWGDASPLVNSTTVEGKISQLKRGRDFVISENKVTRFPEMSSLLLFFNSTTGFSFDCSLSLYGQKDFSKQKFSPKVVAPRSPKVMTTKKKKYIDCNKKDQFISAFGYPLLS
uniref:50S ribosomal protein L5 n=1 Tax=Jaagichlorella roystonensis TaxID=1052852 RepID=A0A6C0M7H2_9CHLO|nr:50S ribosomal protein L5 [Jaagichlorella roystonensis]QHU78334.1 50S ribosomal protein L5 [Jaagichlorella roystonensis]